MDHPVGSRDVRLQHRGRGPGAAPLLGHPHQAAAVGADGLPTSGGPTVPQLQ